MMRSPFAGAALAAMAMAAATQVRPAPPPPSAPVPLTSRQVKRAEARKAAKAARKKNRR